MKVKGSEVRLGDRLWVPLAEGWWGPMVTAAESSSPGLVLVKTWNGGATYLNAADEYEVRRLGPAEFAAAWAADDVL